MWFRSRPRGGWPRGGSPPRGFLRKSCHRGGWPRGGRRLASKKLASRRLASRWLASRRLASRRLASRRLASRRQETGLKEAGLEEAGLEEAGLDELWCARRFRDARVRGTGGVLKHHAFEHYGTFRMPLNEKFGGTSPTIGLVFVSRQPPWTPNFKVVDFKEEAVQKATIISHSFALKGCVCTTLK